jgi:O-antigen/teichoic acid export membrane protein
VDARAATPPVSNAAATTTGTSVTRGGIWNAAANLTPQLCAMAISIAGARFLGPSGLGRQSFIAFVVATSLNLFTFGLPVALMRTVGEAVGAGRDAEARGLVQWAWRLGVGCAAVAGGIILGVAAAGARPQAAWYLAAATAAVGVVTAFPGAGLTGLQRWRGMSLTIITANVLSAATTILVLALGGGITGMIAVQLGAAVWIFVGVTFLAGRHVAAIAPRAADPGPLRRSTVRYAGVALAGSLVTLIVFRRSEFFFLEHYANDRRLALYSVSFAAVTTLVLVPQALATAVSPAFATLFGAGQHERIRSGYSRSLRLLLIAGLPVTAGALALGPRTLRLVFGHGFAGTRVPLLILLAPLPVIPVMNASYSLIVGLGKTRFPLLVGTGSAALNIALDFALIPRHAEIGAAIANSCAQGATAAVTLAYGVKLVGRVRWEGSALLRAAIASAGAGAAAWAVLDVVGGAAGVVAGLVAGLAAFAGLAVALRVLSADDARWLSESFGGRAATVARLLGPS